MAYDFYAKNDYLPAASVRKTITVPAGATFPLTVSCPLAGVSQGTVDMRISNAGDDSTCFQQMVSFDAHTMPEVPAP